MPFVSVERALVAWAKANGTISGLCGGRIASRLPEDPTMPFLTVTRVGGGPVDGEAPIDLVLVQWSAYGARANRSSGIQRVTPDYQGAEALILAVMDAAFVDTYQSADSGLVYGFQISSMLRVPEEDTQWAHYACDMFVTMREEV